MEDSRLKGHRGQVTHPTMNLVRTYCVDCGRPWGWCGGDNMPSHIQVICDGCFDAMNEKQNSVAVPVGLTVPQSYLEMYGLYDENDPRVTDIRESTYQQEKLLKQFCAEKKLSCPGCGSSDYHLEDNPDNPSGPQVAVCHPCTKDGGSRRGWLLRERIELVLTL